MALLFLDGFDHSGTSIATHATKYFSNVGSVSIVSTPIRTGLGALKISASNSNIDKNISIPMGTSVIIGFAFQKAGNPPADTILVSFNQRGISTHIGLGILTTGQFVIFRNTISTILATGTSLIANNAWYYIELKAIIHDTTGSYEFRIDGATELTATNVDTRNAGTGAIDSILIGTSSSGAVNFYFDDLYNCDGTGSAPTNDFLGAIKVDTLLPQTDAVSAGSNAGLTPSTGTDHGALVDEVPPNTTDYNSGSTVGVKDTYQYPNAALAGTIVGIQTNLYVQKTDAGARSVAGVVRTNSVDYDGANASPTTTYGYLTEVRALNPNTGVAWTTADINAIQVGMKVTV